MNLIRIFIIKPSKDIKSETFGWMLSLTNGHITLNELHKDLDINFHDLKYLYNSILNDNLTTRKKSITILSYFKHISKSAISRFLYVNRDTVIKYIKLYETDGIDALMNLRKRKYKKYQDKEYINYVFKLLHEPPSLYDINRTTWRMDDLYKILDKEGHKINRGYIRNIIKNAGYRYRKAKKVLTSNDPTYREKVNKIKNILSNLQKDEKFFSIDEYGPFAIKIQGGKSLVPPNQIKTYPQWQKNKGCLIMTAALELSTN